jgi:hypothetical protein
VEAQFPGVTGATKADLILAYGAGLDDGYASAKAIVTEWAHGEASRLYDEHLRANH